MSGFGENYQLYPSAVLGSGNSCSTSSAYSIGISQNEKNPVPFMPSAYKNFESNRGFGKSVHLGLDLVMTLFFIYVPARLPLIVQAFVLLRV